MDSIPNESSPNNAIYWLWIPLCEQSDSRAYYENRPEGLVVEFENYGVNYYSAARLTAEIVLKPSGEILIQYQSISSDWPLDYGTVGIENLDGTSGLQIACNESYIQPSLAVHIAQQDWLRVNTLSGSIQVSLLYTSPSPRDRQKSRMPSSA